MEQNPTATRNPGSLDALVSLGDYVLATKYSDCDPGDPWRVGYVVRIIKDKRGGTYIIGNQDGTWSDFREYNHCRKITPEEGKAWIEANTEVSDGGTLTHESPAAQSRRSLH